MVNKILFNCENSKIYVRLWRKYHDPKKPDKPEYYTTKHQTIIYDLNSKDSIDVIDNNYIFLSNTCKYMIKGVGGDNGIEIYDFNTKEFLFALPLNILTVSGLEFSPDDRYLVTASNNNAFGMTIWNMATGKEHFHYISGATYSNIDVSHDGRFITYSIGGGLRLIRTHFDGVSVNDTFSPEKTFYPNPTNNTITLSFSIEKPLQLNYSLYNGTGNSYKILLNEFSNPGIVQKTFNISELPNGTYFLKITCQEFSLTYKVVIMR
jgi:WD40 repeat protein